MSFLWIMTQQTGGKSKPIHEDQAVPAVSFKSAEQKSLKDDDFDSDEAKKADSIYAASNLEFWGTNKPHYFGREISINGTCFRKLDPGYFAWLR